MDVQFPLFVLADDSSMCLVETPERVLYHLEAIDIENGEYLFWDSTGTGVTISVAGGKVKRIATCDQKMSLREAFEAYAAAYGLRIVPGESPVDTWNGFQSQLPPRRTIWERLFGKSKS